MQTLSKPHWIKAKLPGGENYGRLKGLVKDLNLNTVCEEAKCPNIGECWGAGTLTFMILGDTCTRSCGFCHVKTGKGGELDWDEPQRVASAVKKLAQNNSFIKHIVVTSVNRDDKNYESACIFAETVRKVRYGNLNIKIEVLIPDFKGDDAAIDEVIKATPDILNHNLETVPRLYSHPQLSQSGKTRYVRPQAVYERSLRLLERSRNNGLITKTGIMVGLGESYDEIIETLRDLKSVNCDIVTIGQYLQPTVDHIPVSKYYHPTEFESLKQYGERIIGIPHIESGPLVRSSYHAEKQLVKLSNGSAKT